MWLINSPIGRKVVMSVTGICLILFLTFHACMNVVALFSGKAYNTICELLGANWYAVVATLGLAFLAVCHFVFAFWLTMQNRKARGNERYGLVVSSKAYRLKPLAIDVRCKPDTVHWFLDDINDVRSSLFLEDAASEFDIQGLELDWTCLIWDGDLRYIDGHWDYYEFNGGTRWNRINKEERKLYQLNAYRVLLTRARQGMVICVPEGDPSDPTRQPEIYDCTYNYLKSIGLEEL